MSGKYLLDTNIIVALFAKDNKVQIRIDQANVVLIPSIVIGELYYGARKSTRIEENLQKITELMAVSAILDCDSETAYHYGIIKNGLKLKGKPIPENDIWIAATALQYDLVVVSRDAHFHEVAGLSTESW